MLKLAILLIFAVLIVSSSAQDTSDLCDGGQGKFDTIFSTADDKVYIIKGDKYWELDGNKDNGFRLKPDYPRRVQQMWPGLPDYLDTAFTDYAAGKTYFLKGTQMWVYNGKNLEQGYPKSTASKFPGLPGDINGAFICTGYNYFFKGDKYYDRYGNSGSISSKWRGLPNDMHAAVQFSSRGHTFFFKDFQFYKFRVWDGPVEDGYPKNVVPFWFQCDDESSSDYPIDINPRGGIP